MSHEVNWVFWGQDEIEIISQFQFLDQKYMYGFSWTFKKEYSGFLVNIPSYCNSSFKIII